MSQPISIADLPISNRNRAIENAKAAASSALGFANAVRALGSGLARELFVTRRFVEMHPTAAANAMLLAEVFGVRTTRLTGHAELQLDLAAGGVAALTR